MKVDGFVEKGKILGQYINSTVDLFITGISLEERCPKGWQMLKGEDIKIKNKVIFYFKEVIKGFKQKGIENPQEYFDNLFDIGPGDCKLTVSLYDEITGLMELEKYLNESFSELKDKKVVIDFSIMIKPYIFILLKYLLCERNMEKIYLLYTEPASYHKLRLKKVFKNKNQEDSEYFTKGTVKIGEVPTYSGKQELTKKSALVVLLGFEGERAVQVFNKVSPDLTIPVNGFPAYRPEFKDISILSNEELLKDSEIMKELMYAPANDPFETKNTLEEIYSKHSENYNISVSPLGTKPMAIGSCLFALEHSDIRIIYPYPIKYNIKSSKGFGETWNYIVSILR